jgi:hypothetical protein
VITRVGFIVSLTSLVALAGGGCKVDDGDTGEAADTSTESAETGGEPIDCGESECAADQACLTFFTPPMCMNKFEDEPCPDGTTEAHCGGAGIPCCCGPTPAPVYECVATSACGELVDCACLADVCVPDCSATAAARVFYCQEPAAP